MFCIYCPCPGDNPLIEQVRVLGLLHEELHGPGPVGAVSSLAHTEVTLSGKMDQTSASILCRRPQQRATYQVRRDNGEDWRLGSKKGQFLSQGFYCCIKTP